MTMEKEYEENFVQETKENIKLRKPKKFTNVFRILSSILGLIGGLSVIAIIGIFFFIRGKALNVIEEFEKEIAIVEATTFVFDIKIEEQIPIDLSWKLSELVDIDNLVPDSIHISDTFKVEDNVLINDDISTSIEIPLVGTTEIVIPVEANIPISMDVPIDTDISLDNVTIEDQNIIVNTVVPVDIEMTVERTIDELGLSVHLSQMKTVLKSLKLFFLSTGETEIKEVEPQQIVIEIKD
jgi:hypothetical protein